MPNAIREFAGVLNTQITLEQPSETGGDAAVTWPVVATVWAEMLALGGAEVSGLEATGDYRLRLRFREDITPRQRIGLVGTARKLQIISIMDPDGRRRETIITARETV